MLRVQANRMKLFIILNYSSMRDDMFVEHAALVNIGKIKILGEIDESDSTMKEATNEDIEEVALNIQDWIVVGHLSGHL